MNGEGKYSDDGNKTTNELVVQKVSVPFVFKNRGTTKTEVKEYLRIFVRPDESHDEPDAHWDTHETDDEAALKQLFTTYGKGHGTTISVRLNVDGTGKDEFFLDVRHPKPDDGEDTKHPSVLVDYGSSIGDLVLDLFCEMSGEDPPEEFKTRGALEKSTEEFVEAAEEIETIRDVLSEFAMPGDLPGHLDYSLSERLRSIFRTAKGLDK